ncbi:hypothetical protein HYU21_00535 [Candidatus Woesearchaeota archaeon]|nr:hypothetical protein [Candidatus Woesearchaeota archaeon]
MPAKISEETVQLIQELYAQDLSTAEIAKIADVSKTTVYTHTKLKERGFASGTEYKLYLAQMNGFFSISESETYLVQERGFSTRTEYESNLVKTMGFASYADYKEHLAHEKGFASITEYHTYLAQERQQRPENKSLSNLINNRLKELNKTQLWLAGELGVTPQAVCKYAKGTSLPKANILSSIFYTLKVPYKTIDDLIELKESKVK